MHAWLFTSCFMTGRHLTQPCRGDTVVLCIGLCHVTWLALYRGEPTAKCLMLYENIHICAHEVLYVQAELLADKMRSYRCEANRIKPAETQMSGIRWLWLA